MEQKLTTPDVQIVGHVSSGEKKCLSSCPLYYNTDEQVHCRPNYVHGNEVSIDWSRISYQVVGNPNHLGLVVFRFVDQIISGAGTI